MAGKTYYVSGTGNDKNNGLKEDTAFRSLGRAVYEMKTGDTLYVMNGTYDKGTTLSNMNGSPDNWTTIKAYPGHTPKIKTLTGGLNIFSSSYVRVEGLDIEGNRENVTLDYALKEQHNLDNSALVANGIAVQRLKTAQGIGSFSHHIVLTGNTIRNFPGGGIAFNDADYITVEKNVVSGNAWYSPYGCQGITANSSFNFDNNTTDYRMIFRDNIVYDNQSLVPVRDTDQITEGHGIMLDTTIKAKGDVLYSGKALIANNVTYNNGGSGIHAFKANNVDIVNNTAYQNGRFLTNSGEIAVTYSENVRVDNNILYASDNQNANLIKYSTNVTFDHNLVYNSSEFQASDNLHATSLQNILGKDPQFVDADKRNFELKPGSAAIDAGSNAFNSITGNLPQDGDGNSTAVIDIGAYEALRITIPEIEVFNGAINITDGSTTAINFGETFVGNTLSKSFTIQNIGTAALNLSNLKLPDGFSLLGTLRTSLAAKDSSTIWVALNTTTPGTYGGSFSLNNNDSDESPFDFAISGTIKPAPTPEIEVFNGAVNITDGSTTAINFGETFVGNTLSKSFTIQNIGTAALNLSNLKLPDGFSLVGTFPTSVAAKASTTISVALNTTTAGTYGGSFSLNNNDSDESPFDFAISGTVKPAPTPEIEVFNGAVNITDGSTTAINFGETFVGNTLSKSFTIQNIGTAALNLSNLKLPDGFSLLGTLRTSLAAKDSSTIWVALNTTTPGTYGGSFSLNNNDSDESPFDFAISGTIKPAPTPEIEVFNGAVNITDGSTTAINFGETFVGNTLTKSFTIQNIGTAALNLSNLKLPDGFSLLGTLRTSLAAKDSSTIWVALNTTTPGTYGGSFSLNNNDSDESPFDFAISGTVKPAPTPEIEVFNGAINITDGSTTAINFGETFVGNTLTKSFTIQNIGTAALNLSNLKLPDGFSLLGTLRTSLAAKDSSTIWVALNTTTPGTYGGSFSLNNNDSDESPFDFAISGTVKPKIQVINGTAGNDTFVTRLNNANDIITNFGGVGTSSNPSAPVIAKVDTLQFIGAGLTARNLQLTQNGNNLEVTFENVANTKVTLQNFKLEDLENLAASTTRPAIGNILFDGQSSVTDYLDVINADSTPTSIFSTNRVTFLNDLNNNIAGLDNSNDVINGQGGNDTINGNSGDDLLRGGTGNDLLIGGQGNDLLIGGMGADAFVYNTNAAFTSAAVGIDTIADFNRSQGDKIVLDKTTFSAINSVVGTGFSNATDFQITSLGAVSKGVIVYDPMTGQLLYNQNGSAAGFGSGGQFAQLTGAPTLTASDFIIQA